MNPLSEKLAMEQTTSTSWQRFNVAYEFPVCFTSGLFLPQNTILFETLTRAEPNKRHKLVIFVDSGLLETIPELVDSIQTYMSVYSDHLELVIDPVAMPGGELIKSDMQYVEQMQKIIVEHHIDRHSYVIGIGGGALLDAVGFVAATSHRGIRHVRLPSTVLAQNDSGVGVKNGVNHFEQKNYMGSFSPPFAVLNDYDFIEKLPERDKVAGIAEAVKVALIRDAAFYEWLEQNTALLAQFEPDAMRYMIKRCAELHMHQIGQGGDPFETGSARPLDYGHWSAHRLETLTHYDIRHGEAVAIGIALDARYSVLCGLMKPKLEERICALLESIGFDLWHPTLEKNASDNKLDILKGLSEFREHLGGELTITLLESLGTGIEVHSMDEALVVEAISWLKQRQPHT